MTLLICLPMQSTSAKYFDKIIKNIKRAWKNFKTNM